MNRILLLALVALVVTGCVVREGGGYDRGYGYNDYDRHGRYEQRGYYWHGDDERSRYWR
jgi:hypothetical protein